MKQSRKIVGGACSEFSSFKSYDSRCALGSEAASANFSFIHSNHDEWLEEDEEEEVSQFSSLPSEPSLSSFSWLLVLSPKSSLHIVSSELIIFTSSPKPSSILSMMAACIKFYVMNLINHSKKATSASS